MKATAVAAVEIDLASAKVRTGPPTDEPEDLTLPHWAGVIPLALQPGAPAPAHDAATGPALPQYLKELRLG